jgi:predicted DNA-binding transcriptional regulator AlpA
MSEELLTRPQLAIELGLSERSIIRLEQEGKGPPRTVIGRRITYRREAIQRWLKKREQSPAATAKPRAKGRAKGPSATGRHRPKSK